MEVEPLLAAGVHREAERRRLGYADRHVVVGKIARLFHLKGHDDLIRAARRLVDRHPHVRFLLVGDGVLRKRLARQIHQNDLDEHFQFTGLIPPERMPATIAAMDLVVHTSLREGLARALPQAMIVGRPAVSFDVDGAREVIDHEQTGLLVRPRDVAGLAAAIERLVADPTLRQRWADRGRAQCADRFCHQRMTRRLREVYQRTLRKS
jgi:glycosyltransferase involved in cell wall biosynthesis